MNGGLARRTASVVLLGLVLGREPQARADDRALPAGPPSALRSDVTSPLSPQALSASYLRAVIEEGGILVAGAIQYASASSNAVDWDLGYDWQSFRSKLTGQSVRFDTNHFDTNMLTHPVAGTLYYIAARGNRLTVLESFLFATASSAFWEYVGEFREMVSINDLIVTPVSGVVIGEMLTRLGVFFQRGRPSLVTGALGGLFAPSTTLHDLVDGTSTPRDGDVDGLGLTRAVGHGFALRLGGGVVDLSDKTRLVDARVSLDAEVIDVPHYNAVGTRSEALFDTSLSRLHAEGAMSADGVRDLQLDVLVAPVGYYTHQLRREGRRLLGQRFFAGATVGFDYGLHSYAPVSFVAASPGDADQIAGVHAAGLTAEYRHEGHVFHARTVLDARPEFAAVRSLALPGYLARGRDSHAVPTVASAEGYYFALGVVVAPTVELGVDRWTLGAQARFEAYWGLEGLDRKQEEIRNQVAIQDTRTLGRAYLAYAPIDALAARVTLERRGRAGEVADIAAQRTEWALVTDVGVRF